jgi:hypothetical protein
MKNNEIEAFVFFVGETTLENCIESLENQTMQPVEIHIIEKISPISKAKNIMHHTSKVKYHLEVDADMILKEDCIEKLYSEIITDEMIFMVCGKLLDPLLGDHRGAVKLWRTSIIKKYEYENKIASDRMITKKIRERGYRDIGLKDSIYGVHKPDGYTINELWHTMKRTGEKAVSLDFPEYFLRNFDSLINSYLKGNKDVLVGIIAMCYGLFTNDFEEKDYHKYISDEFNNIKRLFRM